MAHAKLPSIQWMLNDLPTTDTVHAFMRGARSQGHRRHGSDLGLLGMTHDAPREQWRPSMESPELPISARPPPIEPSLEGRPFYHMPSALLPPHRSPRHVHARSYSDYTGQRPTFLSAPSAQEEQSQSSSILHRRAVSTNTIEIMLQSRASTDPFSVPARAPPSSMPHSASSPTATDNESDNGSESTKVTENKYHCSYCQKGFSRPSSLRIHIYSHTGEKPFACPEEGCSRKFSVQSNMRRHLRVHRLGRVLKRQPSKALVAKPTWVNVMP